MATGGITRNNHIAQMRLQDPNTGAWVDLGRWAVMEGGAVSSETTTYHDWDGQVKLASVREREDVTVRRLYGRNAGEVYKTLDSWVGQARAQVSRVATNNAGAVAAGAEVLVMVGVLTGASLSGVEKGSNEGTEIELVIAVDPELA